MPSRERECGGRKGIHANKLASTQITDSICFWSARQNVLYLLLVLWLLPKLCPASSQLLFLCPLTSSFCLCQVNGVNIQGLKHSEVVALIRAAGEEVRLLVVDQETDELFHRLGITPASNNVKGQIARTHTHTQLSLLSRQNV